MRTTAWSSHFSVSHRHCFIVNHIRFSRRYIMRPFQSVTFTLVALLVFISAPAHAQTLLPYQNPDLPVDVRVQDLIDRMTLEEKTSMMRNATPGLPRLGIPNSDRWSEA